MSENTWKRKLLAFLHDPPEKAYDYSREHGRRAQHYAERIGVNLSEWQDKLAAATGNLFVNGRCNKADVAKLPDVLKSLPFCQPDERDEIKLSLEQLFLALAVLGHDRARGIAADLQATDANGKTKSRWRTATEKRNTSILAHGVSPVGAEGFAAMKQLAAEFLGFDVVCETHPIRPLDPQWLVTEVNSGMDLTQQNT